MENRQVSKRGLMSGWMEDFILGLSKKAAETTNTEEETQEENEVLAEVNLGDLDKVVWKDETFRVAFDEKGANVINEFGNTVTSIPDVKTIEEVDKNLNGGEIVASTDEVDEEDLSEELDKIADLLEEETVTEACDETEKPTNKEAKVEEEDEDEDKFVDAVASGFEELEAIVASLEKRLATFEQQYARQPQLLDVSTNAEEEEIKHFTESADSTMQEISKDQSIDITSPAGRVELSKETAPVEEVPAVEEVETVVEEPVSEEPVVEETVVEEQPEEVEEAKETEEVEEAGEVEETEETPVEKLSGVAEKIFQQGICPETGEELVKSTTAGNFLGIYSPKGGTEYAVDLRNGDIFKYKK